MYKFPQNIFATIRSEVSDFIDNDIEIVEGYFFNQYEMIKKIHKYYNSQYEKNNYETVNGVTRKKIFYNITAWRCLVASKMIDIDTKEFKLIAQNPDTEMNVFMLEKELKVWLKRSKIGQLLNKIVEKLPVYGTVIIRKRKNGGADLLDLRKFYCDQAAQDLQSSRYNIYEHDLSPSEMRDMKKAWDAKAVDEAIEKFASHTMKSYIDAETLNKPVDVPYVKVFERYGEVPLSWFTNKQSDENKWTYSHYFVAGINAYTVSENDPSVIVSEDGIILFKEQLKKEDLPLRSVKYRDTEGRFLGIGVVEELMEPQRQINKIKNQEDKALELASLSIFQTTGTQTISNVMSDIENGDLLQVDELIQRLDTATRTQPNWNASMDSYEVLADRTAFSHDVVRGEAPPASATLGSVQIQAQSAASVFEYKRENVELFLKDFFVDLVIPDLRKQEKDEHILRFVGQRNEMDKLIEKAVDAEIKTQAVEHYKKTGKIPTKEAEEREREKLSKEYQNWGERLWVKISKDFYDNIDFDVDLAVSGESLNTAADLTNLQNIIGMFGNKPEMLQNPIIKRLMFKLMSRVGMNVSELELVEREMNNSPEQQVISPQAQP